MTQREIGVDREICGDEAAGEDKDGNGEILREAHGDGEAGGEKDGATAGETQASKETLMETKRMAERRMDTA